MSNANQTVPENNLKITPEQALQILRQVAALKDLRLCLEEHGAVQTALGVLAEVLKQNTNVPAAE